MTAIRHPDWFDAGALVADGEHDQALFPPIDDLYAQRSWLVGFATAWAARTSEVAIDAALVAILNGRKALLRQLLGHPAGLWMHISPLSA